MEMEKPCPSSIHKVPLAALSLFFLCCVCLPTAHFSHARVSHRGVFFLDFLTSFLRGVEGYFQLRVTARMPIPPSSLSSFILVQSSSRSDLSVSFSQMSLVFSSSVSARGLMGLTTFASKSNALATDFDVMSQRASVFLVPRWNCVIASTCPANSHVCSRRPRSQTSAARQGM